MVKKDEAQEDGEARKIPNSGDVKNFINRALKLHEDLDQAKADLKGLYDDASDQGIDRKALKEVIAFRKKPLSLEHRQEVNELQSKVGGEAIYNLGRAEE